MWCSGSRLWARCSLITSPNPSEDPADADSTGGSYQPPLLCLRKQSGKGSGSCRGSRDGVAEPEFKPIPALSSGLLSTYCVPGTQLLWGDSEPTRSLRFISHPLPSHTSSSHRSLCCSEDSEGWSHFLSPLSTTATSLEGTLRIHVAEPARWSVQAQIALQAGLGAAATFPSPRDQA